MRTLGIPSALQYHINLAGHSVDGTGTKLTVYVLCVSHIDHHASCGDRATLLPRCVPTAGTAGEAIRASGGCSPALSKTAI